MENQEHLLVTSGSDGSLRQVHTGNLISLDQSLHHTDSGIACLDHDQCSSLDDVPNQSYSTSAASFEDEDKVVPQMLSTAPPGVNDAISDPPQCTCLDDDSCVVTSRAGSQMSHPDCSGSSAASRDREHCTYLDDQQDNDCLNLDSTSEEEGEEEEALCISRLRPRTQGTMQDHTYCSNKNTTIYTTPLALMPDIKKKSCEKRAIKRRKLPMAPNSKDVCVSPIKKSKRQLYFKGARKRRRKVSISQPPSCTVTLSAMVTENEEIIETAERRCRELVGSLSPGSAITAARYASSSVPLENDPSRKEVMEASLEMQGKSEGVVNCKKLATPTETRDKSEDSGQMSNSPGLGFGEQYIKAAELASLQSRTEELLQREREREIGIRVTDDKPLPLGMLHPLYQDRLKAARQFLQKSIQEGTLPSSKEFQKRIDAIEQGIDYVPETRKQHRRHLGGGCTSCSCSGAWKKRNKHHELAPEEPTRKSERLVVKNYKLPFYQLPSVVKLKIFSFLTVQERAMAAEVCQDWNGLVHSPGLWSHITLQVFNPFSGTPRPWFQNMMSYRYYKERIQKFVQYIGQIQPKLRKFHFEFDLANCEDQWLVLLLNLLENCKCNELLDVECDWQSTPTRPPCADVTCCVFNKTRLAFRQHIQRVRAFHMFLNHLTTRAPALKMLKTPFDWSPRSVLMVCRWQHLQVLQLPIYFSMKPIQQDVLDVLLHRLPNLIHLEMGVCILPGRSTTSYFSLKHKTLQVLKITECRGFCVKALNMPSLQTLKIGQHPRVGLFQSQDSGAPCLYRVMLHGSPSLQMFNKHKLFSYWVEFMYDELEKAVVKVCPCKDHVTKLLASFQQ